jgi:nucleoside-diphosphate-sugar epimerase
MMSAVRGIVGRVVAISSMDVYRACGILHRTEDGELQQLPLTEESQLRSAPAYSPAQMQAGKKIFSWMTDDYDKISVESAVLSDPQLPGTVLRLPMVYGCGDPLHRFLPVVKRIQDRRRTILLQDGLAQWRGPKGFVEDVAQAIALATVSNKAAGAIYNIAESDALTELEWARLIATEMRWTGNFVVLPHEKMPAHLASDANWTQHWVASSQRIRQELGYRERIPRADAVRRTVQWEVENAPAEAPAALFNYPAEDAAIEAHFSA